jgi:hypothetical protein
LKPQKNDTEKKNDRAGKSGKARGPVQRDAKEVMAELVAKLTRLIATAYLALGNVCVKATSIDEAKTSYKESLKLFEEVGDRGGRLAMILERIGALAHTQNHAADAAVLLGAAKGIRDTVGVPLPLPDHKEFYDPLVANLKSSLGSAEYVTLSQRGATMPLSAVTEVARKQVAI